MSANRQTNDIFNKFLIIMKTVAFNLCLVFLLQTSAIIFAQQSNNKETIEANKHWESANILTTSESVCYNDKNGALFVSCINGNPLDKDGNGFIAKLSITGEIIILKWIDGLDAPKGMGIYDGFLYVTDIDRVVKISIADEKIVQEYPVDGAIFLNDITVDPEGNIYITDMKTNQIHRIHKDNIELYYKNDLIIGPNGMAYENGKLLIGTKKGIYSLETKNNQLTHLVKNTGSIDGLEPDGHGNYIISDWSGKVQIVNPSKEPILLFNTTDKGINAADIVYIKEKELLLVPTFFDNRVMAFYLSYR